MPSISVKNAALLYKVSERTIYRWIIKENIEPHRGLFDVDKLQDAYDKYQKNLKPKNTAKNIYEDWAEVRAENLAEDYAQKFNSEIMQAIRAKYADWQENRDYEAEAKRYPHRMSFRRSGKVAGTNTSNPQNFTTEMIVEAYGNICYLCGEAIDLSAKRGVGQAGWEKGLHIDHVIPVSKGGSNTLENLRPTHGLCNIVKRDKLICQNELDLS
jgi:HNH endonuclease